MDNGNEMSTLIKPNIGDIKIGAEIGKDRETYFIWVACAVS